MAVISSSAVKKTTKKKRVSKKSKKSWRKHSDIKDVDDFLEISRFEERTGGPASEKADSFLYFVDKKNLNEKLDATSNLKNKNKLLRCHAALVNNDSIKPRSTRSELTKRILTRDRKHKHNKINANKSSNLNVNVNNCLLDLWGAPDVVFQDEHNAKVCRKKPVKVPNHHFKKPSELPSLPLPHPGMSYNPSFLQHQDLLAAAVEVELVKDKRQKRIDQATDVKAPAEGDLPNQLSWLKEMSEGLPQVYAAIKDAVISDEEEKEEDGEEGNAKTMGAKAVWRGDKKTEKQRRKMQSEKVKKVLLERAKAERLLKNEKSRIKSIKKEMRRREMDLASKKVWRELEKDKHKNDTKKLGPVKFVEPNVSLKLTEELEGPLRLLKPEGHILEDMLRNFQRRNMLGTRSNKKPTKRRAPKVFEKKSHKQITA